MITVVSGMPRSGTSLMMQMLNQGGIDILSDEIRQPDDNNPRGYLEYEKVKGLKNDNSWLDEAEGKTLKVISHLLFELPTDKNYQVVFLLRNLDEVVKSQSTMLDRMGRSGAPVTDIELKRAFQKHLDDVREWLAKHDTFRVLYVNHYDLMNHPETESRKVNEFLGGGLDIDKMVACVDTSLYRERA